MKPHDVTHALNADTDDRVIISVTVVTAGGRPVLYRAGRTGGPPHLTHGLPPVSPPRNTIKYGLQTARRQTIIAPLLHPPPADPDYPLHSLMPGQHEVHVRSEHIIGTDLRRHQD
ncbi:hypothetical protein Bbelb_278880 [Branchiostoma belcheri]|nr:hypothetical protein Bbelb_278880 [Branchiostoma belcheri]